MNSARFANRVVYVTGAGSGIGRATAQLFAAEGGRVFAVDVNASGINATLDSIGKSGGTADGGVCDVASMESVQQSVGKALRAFGKLDILVNAAGIGGSLRFEELTEDQWNKTLAVNLSGPFHTTKAALPALLAEKGNIVNVASIAAMRGQAYAAHYSASKAGLVNFTRSIALEFATRGLRANCVCPGGVLSPLIRNFQPRNDFEPQLIAYISPPIAHQLSAPEDVARVIAFLASEDARRINGVALVADSGTLA